MHHFVKEIPDHEQRTTTSQCLAAAQAELEQKDKRVAELERQLAAKKK